VKEREEVPCEFFEAHGDASKAFDSLEEALHQSPLLVEVKVDRPSARTVGFGRDDHRTAVALEELHERCSVIGLISCDVGVFDVGEKFMSEFHLMRLAGRKHETDRVPQGVNHSVDLGGRTSARAANFLGPPFLPRPKRPDGRARSWHR
jgi:hypothetical protein